MEQLITCINCPVGCRMTVVQSESGEVLSVQGNTCSRGLHYAHQECTLPLRMITAVLPVDNGAVPLSVKTAKPVPKRLIPAVMDALTQVRISAPVRMGQVILPDICGTGVDVIATRNLP